MDKQKKYAQLISGGAPTPKDKEKLVMGDYPKKLIERLKKEKITYSR